MKESNELFELCRRVYEATGWFEVSEFYVKSFTKKDDFKNALWVIESYSSYAEHMTKEEFSQSNTVPLYTSDYLLEKLPKDLVDDEYEVHAITLYCGKWSKKWLAGYDGYFGGKNDPSDTPLKALLKLTLELHRDGQL